MIPLKLTPNLKSLRFVGSSTKLKREDDCTKCSLKPKDGKEGVDYPLFLDSPKKYEGAKSRLVIITERAHGPHDAVSQLEMEIIQRALRVSEFDYVYITPSVKCKHNKAPTKKMMEKCASKLSSELALISPTAIICVGKAPTALFGVDGKITDLKMMVFDVDGFANPCKLLVTAPIDKVAGDAKLFQEFQDTFVRANKFKDGTRDDTGGIKSYEMFETAAEFKEWLDKWYSVEPEKRPIIAVDIESTGLLYYANNARVRTISFAWKEGVGRCIPVEWDYEGFVPLVKQFLEDPNTKQVYFNGKFDIKYMRGTLDIHVPGIVGDVMLMEYLMDPTRGAYGYKLKPLAQKYTSLGAYDTEVHEDDEEEAAEGRTIWETVDIHTLAAYNVADCDATLRIYYILLEKIRALKMMPVHKLMSNGLMVLTEMEFHGVLVNTDLVKEYREYLTPLLANYTAELEELVGKSVDWNSNTELGKLFYDELKYTNPFGKPERKTDEDVLELWDTELSKAMLKYRRVSKMLGTYINGYFAEDKLSPTSRLHGSFHQTGTKTGRLSSSNPNIQNITSRIQKHDPAYNDLKHLKIKKVMQAAPGWSIVAADLSQAELRVATCASNEPGLVYAFCNGLDLHSLNAKNSFGITKDTSVIKERLRAEGVKEGSEEWTLAVIKYELGRIKEENSLERDSAKSLSFGILDTLKGTLYGDVYRRTW